MKDSLNTIYIISKGRPKCKTARTLTKMNYTGEWFIVCGTNDPTIPEYQETWGKDRILIFNWEEEVKTSDLLDNFGVETMGSGAVPVRNATCRIARERGEIRHWQFDDDYTHFRHISPDLSKHITITDGAFFEKELLRIATLAHETHLANAGFCLGMEAFPEYVKTYSRRVFNAHNLPTDEGLFTRWRGRMNDDLINALETYHQGKREMAFKFMTLMLAPTQSETGGNSDIYESEGTVRKTAYAVLIDPKATKLIISYGRYHHHVDWESVSPKMIKESYAKR